MSKPCVICGKNGFLYYPFCKEHLEMKQNGEIVKCENCGKWHLADRKCDCKKNVSAFVPPEVEEEAENDSDLTCIICGEPSDGKHFCKTCYFKYKDRSVDIRITHCRETQILDEYGNCTIVAPDGRKVRSRAEYMILSWLWEKRVRTVYEQRIYYEDETTHEQKELKPDFYLPDYNLYIEYNELKSKQYLKSKEYVMNIYQSKGKKVIIMTDEDLNDIGKCLCPLLGL